MLPQGVGARKAYYYSAVKELTCDQEWMFQSGNCIISWVDISDLLTTVSVPWLIGLEQGFKHIVNIVLADYFFMKPHKNSFIIIGSPWKKKEKMLFIYLATPTRENPWKYNRVHNSWLMALKNSTSV